jgi:hypothetical protein
MLLDKNRSQPVDMEQMVMRHLDALHRLLADYGGRAEVRHITEDDYEREIAERLAARDAYLAAHPSPAGIRPGAGGERRTPTRKPRAAVKGV